MGVQGESNDCTDIGASCSGNSGCCSNCCVANLCQSGTALCDLTCISTGSTIRSCNAGGDCCDGCCINGSCVEKGQCTTVFLIWGFSVCCGLACCIGVIVLIVCLVRRNRENTERSSGQYS